MKIPLDKFENWLRNKNLKDRSIKNYVYYLNKFIIHERFNQESISRFLSLPQNRNTVARGFLVNFRKFLMVNAKELSINEDYYREIAGTELPQLTGRAKERLINPIPHDQIPLLENALDSEKLKLMLLISYYGGLRLGELLKIRILSFNWELWRKDTSKMGELSVLGKGDKEGLALLPSDLMGRAGRYIKENKFSSLDSKLFAAKYRDKLENIGREWQRKLLEAGIKAGITKLNDEGKPIKETVVHPHRLRHSWGSHLINDKHLDIREVQEVLRHSSIQSTQIYTQIDKEKLKERLS
jgi:integrase